jgi:hypothetical protein
MSNNYYDYFQEYIDGYNEDGYKEAIDNEKKVGKEGVYKENYYMRDNLQIPYVQPVLSNTHNQEKIIEFIGAFIDNHAKELGTSGPVYQFTFAAKETTFLYDLFKVNEEILMNLYNKMVEETFFGQISKIYTGWVSNAPYKLLLVAILIESLQKNYEDMIMCSEYMWAFCQYPVLYHNFWQYGVKEDVMEYTIEHLSNKYKVRKFKNIKGLLEYDAHKSVLTNKDKLLQGADHSYTDFIYSIRNQMMGTFRNIARAYYKAIEEGNTQHSKDSTFDDGSLVDQQGVTTTIAQVSENTINKFITNGINPSMVKVVADGAKVDKDNVTGYLSRIFADKTNKLHKLIEDIITVYFTKNPTETSVGTSEFVSFGLKLYRAIGTSNDDIYKEIKMILQHWMYDICDIKSDYGREATWISYTRAIFNYIVFMINSYN